MNLDKLNEEMINGDKYRSSDMRLMQKVSMLKNKNDYDYYLIVCTLCNYNLPEKKELMAKRMEYFNIINSSTEDYSHNPEDYIIDNNKIKVQCKNTGNINKYGLYEYEINTKSNEIVSILWENKAKDCLKYVDSKTFSDKIIVSISKNQFDNFIKLLDALFIGYDIDDLKEGMFYSNSSRNTLIDLKYLTLPFTPYDYQLEDANKIVKMKRALLGHEMGCGKTFISILVGESIDLPKIVICPESLRLNWYKEIKQVHPDADVQILLSNETPHFGDDWTILGYITANKFASNLKQFDCIFIDEVQYCKAVNNWGKPSSKRASTIIDLANNATYCYLLSGTPLPSHNKDLFNILKMLKCPEFDFNSQWAFKNFAHKYCDPKTTHFGMDFSGNSNSDQLHDILSPLMVRRLKRDVLPDLKKQRQFIPLEPKFKSDYRDIIKRLYRPDPSDTYMGLAMTGRKILSLYKLPAAIELAETINNADESVIIVTNFIDAADKLKEHFKEDACEIRGGMSDKAKDQAVEDFQSKKCKVCILNMQAGGVGLTLTAASTMIILDYAWLPSDMTQVEDRICRPGQDTCCTIYYIYCENSVLDKIFIDMISDKSANIDLVVDNESNTFDLADTKEKASSYLNILKQEIKAKKLK